MNKTSSNPNPSPKDNQGDIRAAMTHILGICKGEHDCGWSSDWGDEGELDRLEALFQSQLQAYKKQLVGEIDSKAFIVLTPVISKHPVKAVSLDTVKAIIEGM